MEIAENDYLAHYGILRRSGRYPWGSGGNTAEDLELKDGKSFLEYVQYLKKKIGLTDKEVALDVGLKSTTDLRAQISIARAEKRQAEVTQALALKDRGWGPTAAAERMGIPESTYRSYIKPDALEKTDILQTTANILRDQVDQYGIIDVGKGVENRMGVAKTRLDAALKILKDEGYNVYYPHVKQVGNPDNETSVRVIVPPDMTFSEMTKGLDGIRQVVPFSDDGGRTFKAIEGIKPPLSVNPDRVQVVYDEDGGSQADGVIYVRPGVDDISLGGNNYAQVRIKVGDGHYLKGMAIYKDDLPDGVDLAFNTNKKKADVPNKLDAMKPLEADPDLPFGSVIDRQVLKLDSNGNEVVTSAMNILRADGDWDKWSRTLSSQMLSKQDPKLIREQLDMTFERRQFEFENINSLTNPTVRKKLLEEFADNSDAAAVHLKAAALPGQTNRVLLPLNSMPQGEVYAPGFNNGQRVVLIRHPHGGTFEIPELVVNNRRREGRGLIGEAKDAIGIHHSVAERLSGADFDGDTVLVIPNDSNRVKTSPALSGLKNFDPRSSYPGYDGMKKMANTQTEMGKVSNLITDMTLRGASTSEMTRAVKHSMVVIDAEKHGLNYKQSELDNGIKQLREKYQLKPDGNVGASTLISRAKSDRRVPDYKPRPYSEGGPIDDQGRRVFVETGATNWYDGKPKTRVRRALDIEDDAHTLSSGTPQERMYADYSNQTKALANRARKEAASIPRAERSPSAAKTYSEEVASLNAKLDTALSNAPLERQAQIIANATIRQKRDANPNMDKDSRKKVETSALNEARVRTGAKKQRIEITPTEWEAIQAGAISDSKLSSILNNADMDVVRSLATPKNTPLMSPTKTLRAQSMLESGYTRAEVASALGVSLTTLDEATNE